MKKFVVAPDSYKGTIRAVEACGLIAAALQRHIPDAMVIQLPMADGGEGTVDSLCLAVGAEPVTVPTTDPYGKELMARYARMGCTAVIEMAAAAGLHLAASPPNPGTASTYGVGTLVRHAVEHGCTHILLGLGGSCTNDGGAGMVAALGVGFYNNAGECFIPVGDTLDEIARVCPRGAEKLMRGIRVTALCDVDNALYGPQGAAYVYAPQKGADARQVRRLDENLRVYARVLAEMLGEDFAAVPGAGAAGGMGVAVLGILRGELRSGIETLMEMTGLEEHLKGADMLITGEGRLDSQSMHGKVIDGLAGVAQRYSVPVVVLAGCLGEGASMAYGHGVSAIFSTISKPVPPESLPGQSLVDMEFTADAVARFIKLFGNERGVNV